MNLQQKYAMISNRQAILQEGMNDLAKIQDDIRSDQNGMQVWGTTAVIANIVLVPLNCIVNAFELGTVDTTYKAVVKYLYDRYSASGTRTDGTAATGLSLLKKAVVDALKKKGLSNAVPGANILIGLAQDSLAAYQAMKMNDDGMKEAGQLSNTISDKIDQMRQELDKLGMIRAQLLDQIQAMQRTA